MSLWQRQEVQTLLRAEVNRAIRKITVNVTSKIWCALTDTLYLFTIVPYILHHKYRTGKYEENVEEKFGKVPQRANNRNCLQIHAVSVGEVIAADSVIREFSHQHPDWDIHITVSTATGREVAVKRYPNIAVSFFPLDLSLWVKRFLHRIRPRAVILMELEIWPNFLSLCQEDKIPVIVVNGRITQKSTTTYRKYRWFPVLRRMLQAPAFWLAQNNIYARRFEDIGVRPDRIKILGSIKFDTIPTEPSPVTRAKYRNILRVDNDTKIIIAGSTHSPEETIILDAFQEILTKHPASRLILVPRHPHRFTEVYTQAENYAPSIMYSELEDRELSSPNSPASSIIIINKMGILSELYNAADIVFIGGSFIDHGGQNMLESCGIGKPTLIGPSYYNFSDAMELLIKAGGIQLVRKPAELGKNLLRLLDNPKESSELAQTGRKVLLAQKGCTSKTLKVLDSILQQ